MTQFLNHPISQSLKSRGADCARISCLAFIAFLMDQSWRKRHMRKCWLLCVLLGTLAWGQAAPAAPPAQPAQAPAPHGAMPQGPAAPVDTSASVSADAAVLTIDGVCPPAPKPAAPKGTAAKPASADTKAAAPKASNAPCKTVITKAQFEKLVNSLAPNATMQQKKQLAG